MWRDYIVICVRNADAPTRLPVVYLCKHTFVVTLGSIVETTRDSEQFAFLKSRIYDVSFQFLYNCATERMCTRVNWRLYLIAEATYYSKLAINYSSVCAHRIILNVSPSTKCLWESFIDDNNNADDKMIITWNLWNQPRVNG